MSRVGKADRLQWTRRCIIRNSVRQVSARVRAAAELCQAQRDRRRRPLFSLFVLSLKVKESKDAVKSSCEILLPRDAALTRYKERTCAEN